MAGHVLVCPKCRESLALGRGNQERFRDLLRTSYQLALLDREIWDVGSLRPVNGEVGTAAFLLRHEGHEVELRDPTGEIVEVGAAGL